MTPVAILQDRLTAALRAHEQQRLRIQHAVRVAEREQKRGEETQKAAQDAANTLQAAIAREESEHAAAESPAPPPPAPPSPTTTPDLSVAVPASVTAAAAAAANP